MRPITPVLTFALVLSPLALASEASASAYQNCAEAYAAGHSNIPATSPFYGEHLDADLDGFGCDNPPADFVQQATPAPSATPSGSSTSDLAETGGSDSAFLLGAAGLALLAAGGAVTYRLRRRA